MTSPHHNPAGTDGFEFLEFTAKDVAPLRDLFHLLGFTHVANHKTKVVELWKQNDLNFLINAEPNSFAAEFAEIHGPSVCGMAFRVKDLAVAKKHILEQGAKPFDPKASDWFNTETSPVFEGIGGNMLYLVDRYGQQDFYADAFEYLPNASEALRENNAGLNYLDHVTHNVFRGNMDKWAGFYEKLFNFREIRYFDIGGKVTGLFSRAMTGPCSKLRIPINESADDKSQIEEFLKDYNGEGIQHIAIGTDDIYKTVEFLRARGMNFLHTPDTYYKGVDARLPEHDEDLARMRGNRILIDGAPTSDGGRLLQIFTETAIGPVFFEIIQRKGDEGFGEGNFRALFESIELDQMERGVLEKS